MNTRVVINYPDRYLYVIYLYIYIYYRYTYIICISFWWWDSIPTVPSPIINSARRHPGWSVPRDSGHPLLPRRVPSWSRWWLARPCPPTCTARRCAACSATGWRRSTWRPCRLSVFFIFILSGEIMKGLKYRNSLIASGNLLHSYWKLPFIVDLPIENCDFPWFFVCLPEGIPVVPHKAVAEVSE